MKKFTLTAALVASVAFLTACGGGGGGSSGSSGGGGNTGTGSGVINASTEVPANNVAGKPVTIVGVVVSNKTLLDSMNWSFQGSTPSVTAPELTNADCTQVAKTDNPAYNGNSTWRCTMTFTPPADQLADTTYNFRVSGTNKGGFSASAQASVVVKSTSSTGGSGGGTANGITINFSPLPTNATAGQLVNVTAIADSTQGLLNTMVWTISGGNASVSPTLINQDCAQTAKTDNPSGTGSSSWQCTLGLVVPTTLPSNATYNLTLTAANKGGVSNYNSTSLNIGSVTSTSPTIQVTFDPVPAGLEAGQIITLTGQVQTNGSKLTDLVWTLNSANAVTANVSPQYFNQTCANAAKQVGTNSSLWNCAMQMIVPTTLVGNAVYNMALTGKTDSGLSNFGLISVPVKEQTNIFKLSNSIRLLNTTAIRSGDTVNFRCNAQGGRPWLFFDSNAQSNYNYVYQWVVSDSQGLPIDLRLNGMGLFPLVGQYHDNSFVAPTVTQPTTITLACRVTDNITGYTNQNGTVTITYLGTSPFQNTGFGTIGSYYTIPDSVFAISSNTLQITINP